MPRVDRNAMVDLRGHDWTHTDLTGISEHDAVKLKRGIRALEDPDVADATYRLANFGEVVTPGSWETHAEVTWLMLAYQAAVTLDRLPD